MIQKITVRAKGLAPGGTLCKCFAHEPEKLKKFRLCCLEGRNEHLKEAAAILFQVGGPSMGPIYATRDKRHHHTLVLQEFLQRTNKGANHHTEG